ncbi:MAG: hypothetical protein SGI77_20030 [Pirellulaceae bacterium]|nr:hypothetical protein [Pirellulaceae bacterium]
MSEPTTEESVAIDDSAKSDTKPTSPVKSGWAGYLRVADVFWESADVKTIRLLPESGDGELPFTYLPGQFMNAAFWIGGARMIRSYSISHPMRPCWTAPTVTRRLIRTVNYSGMIVRNATE